MLSKTRCFHSSFSVRIAIVGLVEILIAILILIAIAGAIAGARVVVVVVAVVVAIARAVVGMMTHHIDRPVTPP